MDIHGKKQQINITLAYDLLRVLRLSEWIHLKMMYTILC